MVAPPEIQRLTVGEVLTRYTRSLINAETAGTLSTATVKTYQRDLDDFADLAGGDTVLDDLTADDLDNIVNTYMSRPDRRHTVSEPGGELSKGTGRRFKQSVSRLFSYAERHAYLQRNPVPDMSVNPRTRGEIRVERTALSKDSAVALVTAPANSPPAAKATARTPRSDQDLAVRDEVILRILLEVGLRNAELCGLDRSDVTHEDGATWLLIRKAKGGRVRRVPLAPSTAARLQEYQDHHRPPLRGDYSPTVAKDADEALLLTFTGRRIGPRDLQRIVKRACDRLPGDLRRGATPHALRHSMATHALSSGSADVKVVKQILGHASLATTGTYLDEIREELVQAVRLNPITGE